MFLYEFMHTVFVTTG